MEPGRMAKPRQGGDAVRRRGRPAFPKGAGKRHALGLRVTAECRKALEEAAASSGRSISQEIEFRLEQSFHQDATFGGRAMAGLFHMMAGAATLICEWRGLKSWSSDWETFHAIRAAWHELIDQAVPDMPMDWKAKFEALRDEAPGPPPTPKHTGEIGLLHQPSSWDEGALEAHEARIKEWLDRADATLRHFQEIENLGRDVAGALARGLRPKGSPTHE